MAEPTKSTEQQAEHATIAHALDLYIKSLERAARAQSDKGKHNIAQLMNQDAAIARRIRDKYL